MLKFCFWKIFPQLVFKLIRRSGGRQKLSPLKKFGCHHKNSFVRASDETENNLLNNPCQMDLYDLQNNPCQMKLYNLLACIVDDCNCEDSSKNQIELTMY